MGIMNWLGKQKSNQVKELPQVNATDIFNAIEELENKITAIEDEVKRNRIAFGIKHIIMLSRDTTIEAPSFCGSKEGVNIMYNTILNEINRVSKNVDEEIAEITCHTR